jgi:ubiquinone/menaquinone biosynthesis C-methylase UbiE
MQTSADDNLDPPVERGFCHEWSTCRHDINDLSYDQRQAISLGGGAGLDVCCDTGHSSILVALHVQHLPLLDPSEALSVAKQNLPFAKNISYQLGSVANIPLPSKSIDFAFSLGVLHHVPETEAARIAC